MNTTSGSSPHTRSRRERRLSFRTRLTLTITAVFVATGACLLVVQNIVVQQLFSGAIATTMTICSVEDGGAPPSGEVRQAPSGDVLYGGQVTGCQITGEYPEAVGAGTAGAVLQQSRFLVDVVSSGLLFWSVVVLLVFTAAAAALAYWLAKRSLGRIAEVTTAAQNISEHALDRRLGLPGPDDEIKELGDTFDGMLDRLQLAFAAQDRFVANASHELRTPLTVMRTALEIPLEQGDVPKRLEPALRRALRATGQSERLITALLVLARSRTELTGSDTIDLAAIVGDQLDELGDAAALRGLTVARELADAQVVGEPALVERAVRNLLDNAIRHNTDGGELSVTLRSDDGLAVLEVANSGAILTRAGAALLAEPFHRGDHSRLEGDRDGVGLGLAIVTSIAGAHGGGLDLEP
ncbi:MAG TPA: ATP-binding protein, partial [Pseudolysinimonas sp.]|nr:ATP-binding protein [Pseudolysinimonas sp.]